MFKSLVIVLLVCATYGQANDISTQIRAALAVKQENANPNDLGTCNANSCRTPGYPNCCNDNPDYCCPSGYTVCCGGNPPTCCNKDFPICGATACYAGGSKLGINISYIVALAIIIIGKDKIGFLRNIL